MRRALFRETGRIIPGTSERIVEGIFLAVGLTYIVLVCHTGNYYIHLSLSFLFLSLMPLCLTDHVNPGVSSLSNKILTTL